jgi:hypothetical protein
MEYYCKKTKKEPDFQYVISYQGNSISYIINCILLKNNLRLFSTPVLEEWGKP